MDRFEILFRKHNVAVERADLCGIRSEMQVMPGVVLLAYDRRLHPYERDVSIATQLGHLEMGHPLTYFADAHGHWWRSFYATRAKRWAARYLIPDGLLDQAWREGWTTWELAMACGVTPELAAIRGKLTPFFCVGI